MTAWLGRFQVRLQSAPWWIRVPGEIALIVFVIVPTMVWSGLRAVGRVAWRWGRGR